ncbi:glycoside hydrolase family 97 protein [Flavobacterium sp. MC2016-06]|uniref:glycoside hydrolase family 97 protein n=1 Tax=Flavobacterium sp. MC2016-06 TaxID=2676308 RepID=UPI0012BAD69B|nr:glycoside hydrolase family 97 protein [Flavobacterium sp. MC2016-06]MBU3860076.1 glycoside hydrolase family 97 protein [Flavobacterium sp. MC2016-06]
MKKYLVLPAVLLSITIGYSQKNKNAYELASPNGQNKIKFELVKNAPKYAVSHGKTEVITPSDMGFLLKGNEDLSTNFEIKNVKNTSFDETWEQVWGEKKKIRNHYNQLSVELQQKGGNKRKLEIQFRAFDDGVAFRYVYPKQDIKVKDSIFIMDEKTTFNLKEDGAAWWIPAYKENRYEYLYTKSPVSTLDTVHTPLTIESKSGLKLSFHEANLIDFASTTLVNTQGTQLKTDLVPWADGVKVRVKDTFTSSWRTLQIAENAGDLIDSYLILNLNEPNKLGNPSYVKSYKYFGIWWAMHIGKYTFWEGEKQGATTVHAKDYIDFTAKEGLHHLLIEGWNKGWTPAWYENKMHMFSFTQSADNFDLEKVVEYGKEKGVELIGYHETGSNLINYMKQIDAGFALYQKLGIHTVKIGHVGSKLNMKEWHHGQFGVNYFRYVLEKAAQYDLAVFYHEPIKDTGERRTYPNMLAREAARGQEYNAWSEGNPPNHVVILPFTRMLSGPMEYTPGVLDVEIKQGYPGKRVHGTTAQQLAMYVCFYSPIQMLADLPENYNVPAAQFLLDVPTDWKDTKVLNAEIGEYLTTVRKDENSEDWYLGSMTNEKSRDLTVSLSFLDPNATYEAQIYADADGTDETHNPEAVAITKQTVKASDSLKLHLGGAGGTAIRFKKN